MLLLYASQDALAGTFSSDKCIIGNLVYSTFGLGFKNQQVSLEK